jgi:ribosomal protein S18 acetylase RimI-like enzyme
MNLRNLEPSDYPAVISVLDEWWGGRHMSDMLPRLFFTHFSSTSFLAEEDGTLAGFLVGFISQTKPDNAYIHFSGIHPDFRKQGLGRLLYERFFKTVQMKGCRYVRCVTSIVNRNSIAFHTALGFSTEAGNAVAEGISFHPDYDGPGEHRVLFVRQLEDSP